MSASNRSSTEPHGSEDSFSATHWSVVLAAGLRDSPQQAAALEKLCGAYWYPLYAFARRRGSQPSDAEDSTQAFFSAILQKNYIGRADRSRGRFRSFLLTSFKNFLVNEWDRAQTARRGGGRTFISWDAQSAESRYALEPAESQTPDKLFEKSWAVATLEQALAHLREEYSAAGKSGLYDNLKLLLWEDKSGETYAELGSRLGMTEAAVKMAVVRLRRRCRETLRMEIAHTVASADGVDEELRDLISILRG